MFASFWYWYFNAKDQNWRILPSSFDEPALSCLEHNCSCVHFACELNHDPYLDHYLHAMKASSKVAVLTVVIRWAVQAKKREERQISSSTATAIFLSNDVFSLIWSRLVLVATMTTVPAKYKAEACMACKIQWKGKETTTSASNILTNEN